ncbi:MAG: YihY/virulence factor BrkB family protein [Verrucomicrobia bacterium]|nr:YihY/virulence factor BrkB family protein [Verrucomicrobiota bacterium]
MVNRAISLIGRARRVVTSLCSEKPGEVPQHPVYGFLHFWVFVGRSFVKNRCPVRATALAYTTLLALVPLLAVSLGVSTSLLKSDRDQTRRMIEHVIGQVAPQLEQLPGSEQEKVEARQRVIGQIQDFISNIHSGALGVTGTVALVFVAIGLLSTIESSFNDIWGVLRGRSWVSRVIHYWTAITLGPLIVILAMGMAVSAQFLTVSGAPPATAGQSETPGSEEFVSAAEGAEAGSGVVGEARWAAIRSLRALAQSSLGRLVFNLVPFLVLSLSFGLLYGLMPNTRVRWQAAWVGGAVGALLWILNSQFNVVFASRVVSASRIYGPLGVFPVFLIGVYISWLILLFGAQVAYAFQNRHAYLQEKRNEMVSQRGREWVALRMMLSVAERFNRGAAPASAADLAGELEVSPRLVTELVEPLRRRNLLVEVNAPNPAYAPTRPLEQINLDQIIEALRSGDERESATRSSGGHDVLREAYLAVRRAEGEVAGSLTLRALLERTEVNPERAAGSERGGPTPGG